MEPLTVMINTVAAIVTHLINLESKESAMLILLVRESSRRKERQDSRPDSRMNESV